MSAESNPPPPEMSDKAPTGKWGVAPSMSPVMTRQGRQRKTRPAIWLALAALIIVVIVLVIVLI